jgi:hypothetical protein
MVRQQASLRYAWSDSQYHADATQALQAYAQRSVTLRSRYDRETCTSIVIIRVVFVAVVGMASLCLDCAAGRAGSVCVCVCVYHNADPWWVLLTISIVLYD